MKLFILIVLSYHPSFQKRDFYFESKAEFQNKSINYLSFEQSLLFDFIKNKIHTCVK